MTGKGEQGEAQGVIAKATRACWTNMNARMVMTIAA